MDRRERMSETKMVQRRKRWTEGRGCVRHNAAEKEEMDRKERIAEKGNRTEK